jgi:alpha-glucosidase
LIHAPWQAQDVRRLVEAYEAALPPGAWPNWVLGNHDQRRCASRVGAAQARVANMLLLTLRGTPTTYYGEEIGMENVPIPPAFVQDPPAVNQPEIAHLIGRDPVRTPMPWDDSANAGFAPASARPWLPLANDYRERNVAQQEADPFSMLHFYRALAKLRREEPALAVGAYATVETEHADIFAYRRTAPGESAFLIVLNFGDGEYDLDLRHVAPAAIIAISASRQRNGPVDLSNLVIEPNEGLVLRLAA